MLVCSRLKVVLRIILRRRNGQGHWRSSSGVEVGEQPRARSIVGAFKGEGTREREGRADTRSWRMPCQRPKAESSQRVSLANTGLQWVRYIATIGYIITCKLTPPSVSTRIKTTLDLNIYARGDVGGVFMHAGRGAGRGEATI